MSGENSEPKWNRKDAPIINDEGGIMARQQARLTKRKEATRLAIAAIMARTTTPNKGVKTVEPAAPGMPDEPIIIPKITSLKDRAKTAAASYVSCLGMEERPSTERLKRVLDEIEDLPENGPARKQLEPLIRSLLTCKNFEEGKRLFEQLPKD